MSTERTDRKNHYSFGWKVQVEADMRVCAEFQVRPEDNQLIGEYLSDNVLSEMTYGDGLLLVVMNKIFHGLETEFDEVIEIQHDRTKIGVVDSNGNVTTAYDDNERTFTLFKREVELLYAAFEGYSNAFFDDATDEDRNRMQHVLSVLEHTLESFDNDHE